MKDETSDQPFVVLSPACDLVFKSNGEFRTDRILLVEIEKENHIVDKALVSVRGCATRREKGEDERNTQGGIQQQLHILLPLVAENSFF